MAQRHPERDRIVDEQPSAGREHFPDRAETAQRLTKVQQQRADEGKLERSQARIGEVVDRDIMTLHSGAKRTMRARKRLQALTAFTDRLFGQRGRRVGEVGATRVVEVDRDNVPSAALHLERPEAVMRSHVEAPEPGERSRHGDPAGGRTGVVLAGGEDATRELERVVPREASDFRRQRVTAGARRGHRGDRSLPALHRRELWLLAGAIAVGIGVRLAYVLATQHFKLAGDAPEYDAEGWLIANGHWFYTRLPYGILHAGAWKPPGYPAWIGLWYALLGHHPVAVRLIQVPIGAVTIGLSWLLARRLFGPRVAAVAAFVVALYPLAWQFEELLYPESLATPLTLAVLIVIFTRAPSARRAALCGLLLGIAMLVRSSSVFLGLGLLVAWSMRLGLSRGILLSALAAAVAALVIAPWTVRNAVVLHGFVPVAIDDAALYGTFNAQAAHDPIAPYAWLRDPSNVAPLFNPKRPLSDVALRSRLLHSAFSYISAHPESVPAAFYWNGLTRLWDVRRRSQALAEVKFEGRSRLVTNLGLDAYAVMLPLALLGLWRVRRRRALVFGLLAIALGASIVFTSEAGTRYRAPLEPVIAILASAAVVGAA